MEPEDLPWPGELEEEEEETEEAEERANLDSDEVVMMEEVEEEERRYLDLDFSSYESQPPESTDDEEDEEAKAWLQAHPVGPLPPSSVPRHRYSEDQRTGPEKVSRVGERWGLPSGRVTRRLCALSPLSDPLPPAGCRSPCRANNRRACKVL